MNVGTDLTAVVVDEWELVGAGVTGVLAELGVRTAITTRDAASGIRAARQHRVDIVVLGACADGPAAQALRASLRLVPRPRVFLLLSAGDHDDLPHLLAAGADALLLRSAGLEELTEALARAVDGERVISPALLPSILGTMTPRPVPESRTSLSKREWDVLSGIAQGQTNREMAEQLFVGEETVKSHLARLYSKLDATDRRDAVARALALGLLG